MAEKKYVRYVGSHDEVEAYPPNGESVHAKRGERVEVTPAQFADLVDNSGGVWQDAAASKGD